MTIDKEVKKIQQKKGYQNIQLNKPDLRYDEVIVLDFTLPEIKNIVLMQYYNSVSIAVYILISVDF